MSIDALINRWAYTATAAQTVFSYTNRIYALTDMKVYVNGTLQGSGYTVAQATDPDDGGTVTFAVGRTAGDIVVLVAETPATQPEQLPTTGDIPSTAIELGLDRAVRLMQRALDAAERAIRQPEGELAAMARLPAKADRAGMYLYFDSNGDPTVVEAAFDPELVEVSATGALLVAAANAAAALAIIGAAASGHEHDAVYARLAASNTWAAANNFADQLLQRAYLQDTAEAVNALGAAGGSRTIDLTLGNVVTATISTSANTFAFTNPPATGRSGGFTLILTNGGSQTVNWPASVDWAGGVAPTLTSAGVDVLVFETVDAGTTWRGYPAGIAMA